MGQDLGALAASGLSRKGLGRADLGPGASFVAAGNDKVAWTTGCDPYGAGTCRLHRRSISTGATTNYRFPRRADGAIVSPDGNLLAFRLERATTDPRYDAAHPAPPSDIAIIRLDTGRVETVPGLEIPAKTSPGLAFSADSRWLAIALDAGDHVRLLAWRSGLALPFETTPIPGQVLGSPALTPALRPTHR
ncbi:hypothetical protein ACQHIV_04485 [Kribbella sp. GL6]|uniref:hypothetical protein n=1 Tax=Kribbella sp. GL6 TaxID=3419765 RepID=UPI003D07D748